MAHKNNRAPILSSNNLPFLAARLVDGWWMGQSLGIVLDNTAGLGGCLNSELGIVLDNAAGIAGLVLRMTLMGPFLSPTWGISL